MSVIAVKKYKNKIVISADQQTTIGYRKEVDSKEDMYVESNKIFKTNGMIIGVAGSVQEYSFLKIFANNHKPSKPTTEGILEFLIEFQEWSKKKDKDFKLYNYNIFIIEDKIFLSRLFLVDEIKTYSAIGSGSKYALAAFYLKKEPEDAIRVAMEFDLFCSGKIQTIEKKIK